MNSEIVNPIGPDPNPNPLSFHFKAGMIDKLCCLTMCPCHSHRIDNNMRVPIYLQYFIIVRQIATLQTVPDGHGYYKCELLRLKLSYKSII